MHTADNKYSAMIEQENNKNYSNIGETSTIQHDHYCPTLEFSEHIPVGRDRRLTEEGLS